MLSSSLSGTSAAAGVTALLLGCTQPPPENYCAESAAQAATSGLALNGGAAEPSYIQATQAEIAAVVRVASRREDGTDAVCSGIVVSAEWVLTAAHCAASENAVLEVLVSDAEGSPQILRVERVEQSTFDAMLLRVGDGTLAHIAPLVVAPQLGPLLIGHLVQLAGLGASGTTPSFAVEEVIAADDLSFVVTANGYAGACGGDSGGPALTRGADGSVEVWGLLTEGATSCWGEDTYLRADVIRPWVDAVVGVVPNTNHVCGNLTQEGRCFGDVAAWCEPTSEDDLSLRGARCAGDEQCGWSSIAAGYRCIALGTGLCSEVTDLGRCEGGDALSCNRGVLQRNVCSQCEADCVRSPSTGGAVCLLAAP